MAKHRQEDGLSPGSMERRVGRPGKFQGELEATQELYDMVGAGWAHEEVGDVSSGGYYALLVNIPYGRKLVSAILSEDGYGFVSARYFTDSIKASRMFDNIARQVEEAEGDDAEDDD